MTVLVQEDVGGLQVSVDNVASVMFAIIMECLQRNFAKLSQYSYRAPIRADHLVLMVISK